MEITAKLSNAPLAAQKARLVGDQIRGLPVEKALNFDIKLPLKKTALPTVSWIFLCTPSMGVN